MKQGKVVLLAGIGKPIRPTFEFYKFFRIRGPKGELQP